MGDKKDILILGAGFGGLRASRTLSKKLTRAGLSSKYRITLLDKNDYHTYSPTLYEIATTSKEAANLCDLKQIVTFPVREILNGSGVNFVKAEVVDIDLKQKVVGLAGGEFLHFDYLLMALGAQVNFYNIPGLDQYAFTLKTFSDSVKIREFIAAKALDPKTGLFKVVIGGGGSTGVELASEIQTWLCSIGKNTDKICWATITIIEGESNILSGFSERVVKLARKRLDDIGAIRISKNRITELTESEVILKNSPPLSYDMFIWTGGVRPAKAILNLSEKLEGKIQTDENMRLLGFESGIYAVGDNSLHVDKKTGKPVPMVARAAISQASVAAKNIFAEIKKAETNRKNLQLKKYKPKSYPYIVPVGGKYAIASFKNFVISGYVGWFLKGLVELNYLSSIMPKFKALKIWLKGLKIFLQNQRLG